MKNYFKIYSVFLLILFTYHSYGTTYYCGPSGTGSGTGSDLNNRLAFPTANGGSRGNEYVYIEGSYGGVVFSPANSGTTTVIWRKLSSSDSGVAGYLSTLHDDVAAFGGINITRQYLVWQGGARTESTGWSSPVGRYQTSATECNANSNNSDDADFSTISDVYFGPAYNESPSAGTIATYGRTLYFVYNQQYVTFTRCHIFGWVFANYVNESIGFTFEYCDFGPGWGKEAIGAVDANLDSLTVRYCRFWNASQTDPNDGTSGLTAEIGGFGNGTTYNNNKVYGCWFYNINADGRNACIAFGGLSKTGTGNNNEVYNNTFVGFPEVSAYAEISMTGSGNIARNNLFYNTAASNVSANVVSDNDTASTDPFVDYAGLNLRLSGPTGAGTTLSSPYNIDPDGVLRTVDASWDVGAFEFDSGGGGDTTGPTVTITSPTSSPTYSTGTSTIDLSGTSSDNVSVSSVTWSNDRGGSGSCTGTTSWSKTGVSLFSGVNVITITATDSSSNTGTDTITVTYTPSGSSVLNAVTIRVTSH